MHALGLDFGTTNTVLARMNAGETAPTLVEVDEGSSIFRTALCFWHEAAAHDGLAIAAGPAAIREYLEFPADSRFLQSFKSVAASASFDTAPVFEKRYSFEQLGRMFLAELGQATGRAFDRVDRLVVGRPVIYAGTRPDSALARRRYDAMFGGIAREIHYVYEPLAAAFADASALERPATLLVADFGGGTSDFSVVQVAAPGATRRCTPLAHAGVGVAGDRFDARIVEQLVLPQLGKGGRYRSFDKVLDIPAGWFAEVADWSRLALMRNRRTLADLDKLRRSALDPEAIARMIALIEHEQGYALYDAVGRLKRALSEVEQARFRFDGEGIAIDAEVRRADFERWIAEDVARIAAALDTALVRAGVTEAAIDRVFLTGGTSLVPAVRSLFEARFGPERIASGGELTSIAHGLALVAREDDPTVWVHAEE